VNDPCLVSLTVNPLTNQLLALAGDGTVYTLKVPPQGGNRNNHAMNSYSLVLSDRPSWKNQADKVVWFFSSLVICGQSVLCSISSKLYPHIYAPYLPWLVRQRRDQVGDHNQVVIHFHLDIVLTESMMVSLVSSCGRVTSMKGQAPPSGLCLPSLASVASTITVVSGWSRAERLLTKHTSWLMHYSLSQLMQMKYVLPCIAYLYACHFLICKG
jgi:hypothetical protein